MGSQGNLAINTAHILDIVLEARLEETPTHPNGLPGIFQSARMGIGDLSLIISLSREPFSRELASIAWHYNSFAEDKGFNYELNQIDSKHIRLMKYLSTGDTILAYSVQSIRVGGEKNG